MPISIPKLSFVVLIGPSGSGKSTFARKHFLPTEILSSDACRGMVGNDENDQNATRLELVTFGSGDLPERVNRGWTGVESQHGKDFRASVLFRRIGRRCHFRHNFRHGSGLAADHLFLWSHNRIAVLKKCDRRLTARWQRVS